jgi:hypothetical protein
MNFKILKSKLLYHDLTNRNNNNNFNEKLRSSINPNVLRSINYKKFQTHYIDYLKSWISLLSIIFIIK